MRAGTYISYYFYISKMPLPLNTIITDRKETVELRVLTTPQDTMIASIGVLDD
jgi:hypothetical protein